MTGRTVVNGRTIEWVFRHCHPDHTDLRATLEASREHDADGRFHVHLEFGAVYVASEIAIVLAELDYRAHRIGLTRADRLPRSLLSLEIAVSRVLDLTDSVVRAAWGVTADDLRSGDYTRCREVARAARDDGYEAVRYPSARGDGDNYAVFLDRMKPGSYLKEVARGWVDGVEPPS